MMWDGFLCWSVWERKEKSQFARRSNLRKSFQLRTACLKSKKIRQIKTLYPSQFLLTMQASLLFTWSEQESSWLSADLRKMMRCFLLQVGSISPIPWILFFGIGRGRKFKAWIVGLFFIEPIVSTPNFTMLLLRRKDFFISISLPHLS